MRVIGMDVHRSFAATAVLEDSRLRKGERVELQHDRLLAWARSLRPDDEVVLEATGNTAAIVRLVAPHVGRVVIANPVQVRAIAWAKVKTDQIDAATLAKLHASGFLPEVWAPDEDTQALRRRVAERAQLVSHLVRLKNRVHAVLHANLIPRYGGKLFSKGGRAWLAGQPLPEDQRQSVLRHLAEHDRVAADLAAVDKALAKRALGEARVKRLMTIGGVNAAVAVSVLAAVSLLAAVGVLAAVGDIARFPSPEKLVSYLGLNPRVRQSGERPAFHGRISKQGRSHARAMLVEAAWSAASGPGRLRAFFLRVKDRRGHQVAAVATARKLAVLVWHLLSRGEDYAFARPALVAWKLRGLELVAGMPSRRGGNGPGPARDYSLKAVRDRERQAMETAEQEYRAFIAAWRKLPPEGRTGAAKGERRS